MTITYYSSSMNVRLLVVWLLKNVFVPLNVDEMIPWSEEECRNFEHALLLYEKNFHLIQKHKVRLKRLNGRPEEKLLHYFFSFKKNKNKNNVMGFHYASENADWISDLLF